MLGARLLALLFLAGLLAALSVYPLAGSCLALVLPAYAALLWWRPAWWLVALPALLPMLDLAPRTGWFFLEEIDLLLLLTACITYWRLPPASDDLARWPLLFRVALALMGLAVCAGLWRGLQPFGPIDANTFNNYLSPANALRVGKAWIWTLLLLPPLRRYATDPRILLIPGMLLGLLLVSAAAMRERWQFTGLLNFSSDYRITAPFSAMHTGGAALDGYLALSMPLLAVWLLERDAAWRNAAALAVLQMAWYAALATFSRGLYLALVLAISILLVPSLLSLCARRRPWHTPSLRASSSSGSPGGGPLTSLSAIGAALLGLAALEAAFRFGGYRAFVPALALLLLSAAVLCRQRVAPVLACVLLLGAAVPLHHGYFVNVRFASIGNDWSTRVQHWQNSLAMMDADASPLGMGLGKFPATYYWRNPGRELPPSYQFIDTSGNRHLRLSAGHYAAGYGELLRIQQSIQLQPHQQYLLGVDIWNGGAPAFLHINLCQRQLLYPQNCVAIPLHQIQPAAAWLRYVYTINSGVLGSDRLPLKLEIAAEGQDAVLDIDNISLRAAPAGHELLRNGGFSDANNYWFFSSDRNHLPWHVKNLMLNLYFEMGWLGISAYALLLFSATNVLLRRRDLPLLAALAAFQTVGLFDSLLDVPRITLLSMLLLSAAALQTKGPSS